MDFLVVVLIVCFLEKGDNIVEEGEGDGEDDGNNEDGEEDVDEEEEKGDDEFLSNMYKESLDEDRRRDLSISKDCDIEFVVMGEHDVVVEGRQNTLGGDIDNNDCDDTGECEELEID